MVRCVPHGSGNLPINVATGQPDVAKGGVIQPIKAQTLAAQGECVADPGKQAKPAGVGTKRYNRPLGFGHDVTWCILSYC